MAIIWQCGFESGLRTTYERLGWFLGQSEILNNTTPHKTTSGDGGDYGLSGFNATYTPPLATQGTWVHFWLRRSYPTSTFAFSVTFRKFNLPTSNWYTNWSVDFRPDGMVTIGNSATVWGFIDPNAAHWVAIYLVAANAGRAEVWIDGVYLWGYNGDTQLSAYAGWDRVYLFGSSDWVVDDLIITDGPAERLGEHVIVPLIPNADDVTGLTPSSGTDHFQMVNERPPTDVLDYNGATAVGQYDTYDLTDLGWDPVSIPCVEILAHAVRAGTLVGGKVIAKPGAIEYRTALVNLLAANNWAVPNYVMLQNPDGGGPGVPGPWTKITVNALKAGFEFD